ncbi:hypothetical protein SSS_04962 [Sarcoptes scabiei]|nr:hypothetical protein SSS_04962 [Sarcoptes scabiei]
MCSFFNNFSEIASKNDFSENTSPSGKNSDLNKIYRTQNRSSSAKPRPISATSILLNMANSKKLNVEINPSLNKSKTIGNLRSPQKSDRAVDSAELSSSTPLKLNENLNDSMRSIGTNQAIGSNYNQNNRKLPSYLSRDFRPCDWPKDNDCFGTLGNHSVQEQEQLLLRDLLFVLIGIEGRYIRLNRSNDAGHYKLTLDSTTDHFLAVTTNRILKICSHYSVIVTFIESKVYGLVNQALVASIHQHIYDYNMDICRMEESLMKNDLFLQKMFFILLSYFPTFSLLKEICVKLYKNKSVGGAVLSLLHEKTKSIQGMDNKALELCLNMTKSAAIPYFEILKIWIYYGEIGDPRKEFFIEDTHNQSTNYAPDSSINLSTVSTKINANQNDYLESDDEYDDDFGKFNDKYWDVRFRINSSKTPSFLKKYENIIYKTGKYVSIINKVKQLFLKSSKVVPVSKSIVLLPIRLQIICLHKIWLNLKLQVRSLHMFSLTINPQLWLPILMRIHSPPSLHLIFKYLSIYQSNALSSTLFVPKPEEIYYSFDETTYTAPIISAYEEASSQLLHILMNESQLVETFNSVKHYMLLSMGDFIVHFMKFASKDLCKQTDSVVQHRLDSMMGMALGISVCTYDRQYLKDDPHIEFVGKSFLMQIYQIMRPLNDGLFDDPSPSSSCLLRYDEEFVDEEDGEDVPLNRSIIGSVIEADHSNPTNSKIRTNKYLKNKKEAKNDANKMDQIDNEILKSNKLQRKLFCYESLMLKFDVPFPLSLIFTQKSIVCYELLFRYLFLCRYAEMELEETWKDNILNVQLRRCDTSTVLNQLSVHSNEIDGENSEETARLLIEAFKNIHKKAFALRYKMIAFVRNFHYFYALEVIDPFFANFINQISSRGSSLDSVIECHEKFLEHCFSSCFLTSVEITTIIIKIFTLCIELSQVLKDSIDQEDQCSMIESSCFFGPNGKLEEPNYPSYNRQVVLRKTKEIVIDGRILTRSKKNDDKYISDKLDEIYFHNKNFGSRHKSASRSVRKIIDKANSEFDLLVNHLLKKIYSDNCEYHMMYPFVARLDYNDFYRTQMLD